MKIKRPLVFFDIESTGLNTKTDQIVEISLIKVFPDKSKETKTFRIKPHVAISKGAFDTHHISMEDLKNCESFHYHANAILEFLKGTDIVGFNSNRFDIPLLYNEFQRAGIEWDWKQHNLIDVGNLYKIENPRTLVAAYKQYTGEDLEEAHSAQADVEATIKVFDSLTADSDLTPEELALKSNFDKKMADLNNFFSIDVDNDYVFNFGKYRGEKANLHLDFVEWMAYKDFPSDTLKICDKLLN